jgi:hypothetical protein
MIHLLQNKIPNDLIHYTNEFLMPTKQQVKHNYASCICELDYIYQKVMDEYADGLSLLEKLHAYHIMLSILHFSTH